MKRRETAAPSPQAPSRESHLVSAPTISLPKGGGSIRGIGEKFAANPVTGTGAMTIPIATSPGRSGFQPQLTLSYDSGSGNSSFALGWSLGLPQISRKTEKGLPQYRDVGESDVFVLSGAEDLVPVFRRDAAGQWVRDAQGNLVVDEEILTSGQTTHRVRRYRPRLEGLFARIERWTRSTDSSDVHWRSISKDNVLTIYGSDANSRIADPENPQRIFTWLICETRDDKGNGVLYRYKAEDGGGVDLARASERNRGARDDHRRTANRYIKHIHYGNRVSLLNAAGSRPRFLDQQEIASQITDHNWMFEVVFDYGEHDLDAPTPGDGMAWTHRSDAFSTYRAGFEVRTARRCRRVLMFHHFPDEPEVGADCLVRSTDFVTSEENATPGSRAFIYTFLRAATQTSYRRSGATYIKRSLPPVEFEYSEPVVQDTVQDVDLQSLENLPIGVNGSTYQWIDLHGEGLPGILTEQAGGWFYKRNLSPISAHAVEFAPLESVAVKPNLSLAGASAQFIDLAGDGQQDLVEFGGTTPGFYEHDDDKGWRSFRPLSSGLNRELRDPNVRFIDLDGDGRADVLITEDDALVWHESHAEEGFGPAIRVAHAADDEKGPRLVFADGEQAIYIADLSGDGLADLVRIRNADVCYWPNLGYGRFGLKVTMDGAPQFDNPDQFDQKRIRVADIDGSGASDIIYLHRDGIRLYFNQSGNSWSAAQTLRVSPRVGDLESIVPTDLLGNGTVCLVWSSPLPADSRRQMRYVDLMGGQKPHLLIRTINNLGSETRMHYASSVEFYLRDERAGRPWITRLPFPVHVVDRVETYDYVSRSRFVTRYAYHHGYFDGDEREFRGFGMVEQFNTEQLSALVETAAFPVGDNVSAESHVPPVQTKTWFHTGVYLGGDHVSDYYAGLLSADDTGEYFREPGLTDVEARALLLPDTILPRGLTVDEEREASRALKGSMLRQEVYALDGSPKEPFPYIVIEQNFTIRTLQPQASNRHGVFFSHVREAITFTYERDPADPRVQHALTLECDAFGNALKHAAITYGRREIVRAANAQGVSQHIPNHGLAALHPTDRAKQVAVLVTYTENGTTNDVESSDVHRTPLPCETRTFELTGYTPTGPAGRFQPSDLVEPDPNAIDRVRSTFSGEAAYEDIAVGANQRRPTEAKRTLYRSDNLAELLPLGTLESLAIAGESYALAFTSGLLTSVFQRPRAALPVEALLPNPADVLAGEQGDRGGYVQSQVMKDDGRFPATDAGDEWWMPSGRSFASADPNDNATPVLRAATELAVARDHFFLPQRYRDPFGHDTVVAYDGPSNLAAPRYDLVVASTTDALANRVVVESMDYRALQPRVVSDANGNQTAVAFDTLGLVAGTVVMGKPSPATSEGDSLAGFSPDLTQAQVDLFHDADPHATAATLLQSATSRIVYDVDCFYRTRLAYPEQPAKWSPPYAATLMREIHASDPLLPGDPPIQIAFSYSDGLGREIQKKIQAEPEVVGGVRGPSRWVGSGWTIFNNNGKPVRQYEPFFTATHRFEFGVQVGVSPVLFYDPADRVIATLHPNHSFDKVVFGAWQQTTYDVNDTSAPRNGVTGDPRTDGDIAGYVEAYFTALSAGAAAPWMPWYAQRQSGALGAEEQGAATKASAHADTPTTAHFDSLGRTFLTVTRNRVVSSNHPLDGAEQELASRVDLDIEGNQRVVRDAETSAVDAQGNSVRDELGRVVMGYAYDMLGNRIHQLSMDAGTRWMLSDVAGKTIRVWDSRGHNFISSYDALRRPTAQRVSGTSPQSDPRTLGGGLVVDRIEYGETVANPQALNLRTRVHRQADSAGIATHAAYDFKGNLVRNTRQLLADYTSLPDWQLAPALSTELFTSSARYDALNRHVQVIAPHSDLPRAKVNIVQHTYNETNLLERADIWLDRAAEPTERLDPDIEAPSAAGVLDISYDAKGQRQRIAYANGAITTYEYDPLTFRLVRLETRRGAASFPGDAAQPPPAGWPGRHLQNLSYVYDPAGNVTHIQDDAQQTIYFDNQRVEPSNDYTYDALYRLIEARGREHLGQGGTVIGPSFDDAGRVGVLSGSPVGRFSANDGFAMGAYVERYMYDAVGNFLETRHRAATAATPGWTRGYRYAEASVLEDGSRSVMVKYSNRLTSTTINPGGNNPIVEPYAHDVHGNMVRMPHLGSGLPDPNMAWDSRNELVSTSLGDGGAAHHVYDASGQRVRKVLVRSARRIDERLYLGGFEIFRRHTPGANGTIDATTATLERETLHVVDDKQRVALVETLTLDTLGVDAADAQLIRYQLGNHLGSVTLELDDAAEIISYEEYTPYGCTSYQAVRSAVATGKRYRYTGKERDEESGFYYHGARHYAPWLGRWVSCDPGGLVDGLNLFAYVSGNPVSKHDPTGCADDRPPTQPVMIAEEGGGYVELNPNDQANYPSFEAFASGAVGPWTEQGLMDVWNEAHPHQQVGPTLPDWRKDVMGAGWPVGPQGPFPYWTNVSIGVVNVFVGGTVNLASTIGNVGVSVISAPFVLLEGTIGRTNYESSMFALTMFTFGVGGALGQLPKLRVSAAARMDAAVLADTQIPLNARQASVGAVISRQRQARHILNDPAWVQRGQGGYFTTRNEAQQVLDEFRQGANDVRQLGAVDILEVREAEQQIIFQLRRGNAGFNNNVALGFLDQPTNMFMLKGLANPSIVPIGPGYLPGGW